MARKAADTHARPGPTPERLKIDLSFEAAADRLVKAKKPVGGWPGGRKKKARKRRA